MGPGTFLTVQEFIWYNCSAVCGSSAQQWLYGRVNGDLLKRAYATWCTTQISGTQSLCPCSRPLLTCTSAGDTDTLKDRSGSVSVGSLGPGMHKAMFERSKHLWPREFDSKCDFACPTVLLGLLLHPLMWGIFLWWDPTLSCCYCSAASCSWGFLAGEDKHMSFYSSILLFFLHSSHMLAK